jgi:anti-sigma factor (TIGR02949 family)
MTDCGCEKAKKDLEEYLHNELQADDAADIREHLEGCVDCENEVHIGVMLTSVVQRACKETAPQELRMQVLAQLRSIQSTHLR